MKNKIIVLILNFFSIFSFSQKIVSGFVKDSLSKEVLIGANVFLQNSKTGVSTNAYGFFSIEIPKDTATIEVSFIGYKSQKIKIKGSVRNVNILLSPGLQIQEVTVNGNRRTIVSRNETSITHLKMKDVKVMPNLFGEVDIIKALQLTPGVQSGGEGKSDLYVRGGSPDQNLYLLDDVPLYYVGHFGGFFSVFNADAINDVKLIKGGFPAGFGGRLSSVLDIKMKEGNMQKREICGTLGLLSSKISVSAPIKKDTSSFIVSARSNVIPLFKMIGAPLNYYFFDANAKANYILSDKNRLFLSFYIGNDYLTDKKKSDVSKIKNSTLWGNTLVAFRWNHIYNNKLFSNLTFLNTNYHYKTKLNYQYNSDDYYKEINDEVISAINDLGLKLSYSYFISSKVKLKFGANSIYHIFTPNDEIYKQKGSTINTVNTNYSSETTALENAVFVENHLNFNLFTVNAGLRYSNFYTQETMYNYLEPRILANYILNEFVSVKYSYSVMNQFVHLLTYSGTGVPSDYRMPATKNIQPEKSIQHTLGLNAVSKNGKFEISLESYYKTLSNLIAFKQGKSISGSLNNWENLVEKNGTGENYGIEFFIKKIKGKTSGWVSATYARAFRKFENINNGKEYPFKYDRIFDFSIVFIQKLKKNIDFSATWTYGTGYPVTIANEKYSYNFYNEYDEDILIFAEKNSFRMRDYHRLDIALNFNKKTKWGERTWTISVFNLYNRQNPYYYYYERKITTPGGIAPVSNEIDYENIKLYQRSLFGFLPSFAYSFKF